MRDRAGPSDETPRCKGNKESKVYDFGGGALETGSVTDKADSWNEDLIWGESGWHDSSCSGHPSEDQVIWCAYEDVEWK